MPSAQRRHCPPSTASCPVGRASLRRLNGSRANPSGGARTRCVHGCDHERTEERFLGKPCLLLLPRSRCQDRPDCAPWPRPAPLEQTRRLGRVAARARSAQRRLPSSRRRRLGGMVGQHGCRLTPGRAQRCWRLGVGSPEYGGSVRLAGGPLRARYLVAESFGRAEQCAAQMQVDRRTRRQIGFRSVLADAEAHPRQKKSGAQRGRLSG